MIQKDIDRIGEKAFATMIKPLKRSAVVKDPFVGFDTEYDSKTRKFLSFQLWYGSKGGFYTCKPTPDNLALEAQRLVGKLVPRIILVSYFSIAELQFMPMEKGFDLMEYGSRSLDISFEAKRANCILTIFDLARFFDKQSLSNAAVSVGLKKKSYDTKRVSARSLKDPRFRRYAIHDAFLCYEITRLLRAEFMERGVDILDAKTPANASARVFRSNYVPRVIKCDSTRARYVGMRGDWGGRTETYYRGTVSQVWEYDLSSAYPNAAITLGAMPEQKSWRQVARLGQLDRCRAGIGHVGFFFPPNIRYPCLPIVEPDAQLYMREGHCWCTFAEIRLALEMGAKITPIELWGYSRGTSVLADYMQELLEKRKKAKGAARIAYKLQANAIIGKFSQCLAKIEIEELNRIAETEGILLEDLLYMSKEEQQALGAKLEVSLGSVFMPEWNALITGFVRQQLGRAIAETSAMYSATDAIWTGSKWGRPHHGFEFKRKGPAILVRTRLGAILEKGDPHVVHHSIWNRKSASRLLQRFSRGEDIQSVEYRIKRPRKYREALRSRQPFGEWIEETRTASLHWDHKRRLLPDGNTEPWNDVMEYRKAIADDKQSSRTSD